MRTLAEQVKANRAIRDAARTGLESRLAQVRRDLDARGVGGRIADRIGEEARETIDEAIEIADENKAVIAGTVGALGIWALRNPILGWLGEMLEDIGAVEEGSDWGDGKSEPQ